MIDELLNVDESINKKDKIKIINLMKSRDSNEDIEQSIYIKFVKFNK